MRRPTAQTTSPPSSNHDSNNITISTTATLHITLAISPPLAASEPSRAPCHTPILLSSGVVSTSPPYRTSTTIQPVFIPHRPTFVHPRSSEDTEREGCAWSKDRITDGKSKNGVRKEDVRAEGKEGRRHAALLAHLRADLREDGGSWEDVGRESRMGRGGYQGRT